MKKYLILILVLIAEFASSQIRLRQIEPCYDNSGNRKDSCFIMTNAAGIPYYIGLDDLINIVSKAAVNCDSIGQCLLNGNILCNALGNFPIGLPNVNDYIIARNGSNCKRIYLDSLIGGTKLCGALNFSITTISGNDYFLIKKANGDCRKVLASSVGGFGFNCDSVTSCLINGALCDALRDYSSATPAAQDSFIFIKNGECRKGTLNGLISSISCDSVLACLNDGILCDALRSFGSGTYTTGDSIWYSHNGVCKKGLINGLIGGGGGFNCDSVKACIASSWFCDSVTACLNEGSLCTSLKTFGEGGGGSAYYVFGVDGGGVCKKIPWDSVNQTCTMEVEVGSFGGGAPFGCAFATTCDGGNTHSNQHWVFPVINGCNIETWGGAQGNPDCKMGEAALPIPTVTNQSSCSGGGANLKFNFTYCGVTTTVDLGTLTLDVTPGTNTFQLKLNGATCDNAVGCPCSPLQGASTNTVVNNIQSVDLRKIKRYKNHVLADQDTSLPSGGLYFVGSSRSLQVKL